MKAIRFYMILLISVFLTLWLLRKAAIIPSLGDLFSSQPVRIDETPVLVREISEIAELAAISYFDEVVVDSVQADPATQVIRTITGLNLHPLAPSYSRIVLIAKGRVKAGTNLREIRPEDCYVRRDSVSVRLPPSRILETVMNPSDFDTFIETGEWSNEAVTAVKLKARQKLISRALAGGILQKAADRSYLLMENFLRSAGFTKINLYPKPDQR